MTIIRPCKGLEPCLYDCLSSTLEQDYPANKLTVCFCVASNADEACSVIRRVLTEHAGCDAKLLVEEDDPALATGAPEAQRLGPNPKIRNMSRAYREAKGDIVWILDCNIWVGRGVCGRMVDRLCGYSPSGPKTPFKFVHHLPVAVDISPEEAFAYEESLVAQQDAAPERARSDTPKLRSKQHYGGRLDEAFLSSAHAKMYVAINTVAVAPCVCGKSSMFRRSHLNALTNKDQSTETRFGTGIDYFSENICEDHLIGDLLWKAAIPPTMPIAAKRWRNHGLVYGDLALQPISDMTVSGYIARRVRWLRVRKFTVPLATLVEPGTESFACSAIGAFGVTNAPFTKGLFRSLWLWFPAVWVASICAWITVDWWIYLLLHSGSTVEPSASNATSVPAFAQPVKSPRARLRRSFLPWLLSWLCREALTFPVWFWAIWGGVTVVWRDKRLWVGLDMKVHETNNDAPSGQHAPLLRVSQSQKGQAMNGTTAKDLSNKFRQD